MMKTPFVVSVALRHKVHTGMNRTELNLCVFIVKSRLEHGTFRGRTGRAHREAWPKNP